MAHAKTYKYIFIYNVTNFYLFTSKSYAMKTLSDISLRIIIEATV